MLKLHQQLIYCPTHKEKIAFISIEKNCPANQRTLCKKCVHDCETIKLETIEQLLQKNQNTHMEATNKFIQQIHYQLSSMKSQFIQELDHFQQELEKVLNPLTNQKEKFDYYLVPETTLTLVDFQELGQLLAENIVFEQGQYVLNFSKSVTKHHRNVIQQKFTDLEILLQQFRDINNNKINEHQRQLKMMEEYGIHKLPTKLWQSSQEKLNSHCNILSVAINYRNDILVMGTDGENEKPISNLSIHKKTENGIWQLEQYLKGHCDSVTKIYYSKTTDWFISISLDQNMILWKLGQIKWIPIPIQQEHFNWIWSLTANEDESIMATGSEDKTIRIWYKHEDTMKCIQTLLGHIGSVYCVSFNKDGSLLVSGGQDKQIILWRYIEQEWEQYQIINKHHSSTMALHFSIQFNTIFIQQENSIEIWNKIDNNYQCVQQIECQGKTISNMVVCENLNLMVNYDYDGHVFVWNNVDKWRMIQTLSYKNPVKQVICNNDEMIVIEGKTLHHNKLE